METNQRHASPLLCRCFDSFGLLLSGHHAVAIENAALRMQLAAFQRKRKRPLLTTLDRLFWITLRSLWSDWRHPLIYVQADTVVRWHRERVRRFWARLSKLQRRGRGRRSTAPELRRLIEQMAAANPLWRAPGFMANSRCSASPSPSARCRASCADCVGRLTRPGERFLHNHVGQIAIDRFLYGADNHDEGAVRIHRSGTRSSQAAAFQCHRASDRGLDRATDRRGVRRPRGCSLSHPRSGQQV